MAFWSKVDHKQRLISNPDHLRIIKRTQDSLVSAAFQSARNVGHDLETLKYICAYESVSGLDWRQRLNFDGVDGA